MIIHIDTISALPIYEQLRNQIVLGIAGRRLAPGEGLPSVRRLAADLGINFHTVNKSYAMLCDEGYISMDRRKGAVVAQNQNIRDEFAEELSERLQLTAAEAICHGLDEEEYLRMCKQAYSKAKGGECNV